MAIPIPIIDSITIVPPEVKECETAVITIMAHDPTPAWEVVPDLLVANRQGVVDPDRMIIRPVAITPLVYDLDVLIDGTGEVFPDPTHPNVFIYHAPCPNDPTHNPITHVTEPTAPHVH